jgi:hypothetical protein
MKLEMQAMRQVPTAATMSEDRMSLLHETTMLRSTVKMTTMKKDQ